MEKSLSHYLIVTDIDDTLLPHDGEIPKRNLEAIHRFQQKGGKFTFATGRSHYHCAELYKTLGINVRVTPEEKEKLLKNADYCSLSLSEYLRRLGVGKDVEATVREKDYRLFRQLKQLRAAIPQFEKDEIIRCIDAILKELR